MPVEIAPQNKSLAFICNESEAFIGYKSEA